MEEEVKHSSKSLKNLELNIELGDTKRSQVTEFDINRKSVPGEK